MGRWRSSIPVTALVVASLPGVNVHTVHADDVTANIQVQPGATCIDALTLGERIEHFLGRPLPEPPSTLVVHVVGSEADPRSVTVAVSHAGQPQASRSFQPGPARCEDLVDAAALAATMMLQALPEEAWHGDAWEDDGTPESPAVAEPVPYSPAASGPAEPVTQPTEVRPLAEQPRSPRSRYLDAFGALWAAPAAEGSGVGGEGGLGMGFGEHLEWRVGMLALAWPSRPLETLDVTFSTLRLSASSQLCGGAARPKKFRVLACLGLLAGRTRLSDTAPGTAYDSDVALRGDVEGVLTLSERVALFVGGGFSYRPYGMYVEAQETTGEPLPRTEIARGNAQLRLGVRLSIFAKRSAESGMNGP